MIETDDQITDGQFSEIVRNTPLVSIDLIVRDKQGGRVLLGLRKEAPAENWWFVPGGRIKKDKKLSNAFSDIAEREIGISADIKDVRFWGVFEHHYKENKFKIADMTTHYVVIAFEYIAPHLKLSSLSRKYHKDWKWLEERRIVTDKTIHKYTRDFFIGSGNLHPVQYPVAASYREHFNSMVWQTPAISLAAQAFLLSSSFSQNISLSFKALTSGLAFIVAICSIQLLFKHRYYERNASELLKRYERTQRLSGFHILHGKLGVFPQNQLTSGRSHVIWMILLGTFAVCALVILGCILRDIWSDAGLL